MDSRRRSFREQLSRAADIQRSLLPDISTRVGEFELAGLYLPCEALGGDFYDLVWGDDCALLLVADVMGHGAEAALVTMLVKAEFAEAAAVTTDPSAVLDGLGERLRRLLHDQVFVAAAVARIEPVGSTIRIANAGLPHPFLLRSAERQVEEVHLDGRPIGLLGGTHGHPPSVADLRLFSGDVLLIASDGVGAVASRGGQLFEDTRLRSTLQMLVGQTGSRVIERLVAEASSFAHGQRFPDDVNMITIMHRPVFQTAIVPTDLTATGLTARI